MIDQYSPQQLGSSVGKPIKSFHPSIKQQGEGNIPNTTPCCPVSFPPENRLVWQSAGGSPLSTEETSVWMWKSLTKSILLLLEFFLWWCSMGTILLALLLFCWMQKGLAAPLHCLLKCFYWTCWVVRENTVSSRVYDKVTWIIKWDENFIMGIDEQCGLGTFGSNIKESGGLNQHLNSQDYSSAHTFFPFLAASNVCQKIHFIRTRMDRLSDGKKATAHTGWSCQSALAANKNTAGTNVVTCSSKPRKAFRSVQMCVSSSSGSNTHYDSSVTTHPCAHTCLRASLQAFSSSLWS